LREFTLILLIFAVLVVLASIPTWIVPRRYFIHYLSWIGVAFIIGVLSGWRPGTSDTPGDILEVALFSMAAVALAAAIAVRLLHLLISRLRLKSAQAQRSPPPRRWVTLLTAGAVGMAVAFASLRAAAHVFQGYQPAWVAFASLLAAALLILGLWRVWLKIDGLRVAQGTRGVINALLAGFCSFAILSQAVALLSPMMLRHQIEALVGDRRYCVQITDATNASRSLPTLLDLSILSIGSLLHNDPKSDQAPIVVEGSEGLIGVDWPSSLYSFRRRDFTTGAPAAMPVFCEPTQRFLDATPLALRDEDAPLTILIGRHKLAIPSSYQPSGRGGKYASLAFQFPMSDVDESVAEQRRPSIKVIMSLTWDLKSELESLGISIGEGGSTTEFSLKKSVVSISTRWSRTIYSRMDATGAPSTLIACEVGESGSVGGCAQRFDYNGIAVTMSYPDSEVAKWQLLESRLAGKLDSWRAICCERAEGIQ